MMMKLQLGLPAELHIFFADI